MTTSIVPIIKFKLQSNHFQHFHRCAYEAQDRGDLIKSIDEFLDDSVVIPPGKVDSKRLLSGDEIKKALRRRKKHKQKIAHAERAASVGKERLLFWDNLSDIWGR